MSKKWFIGLGGVIVLIVLFLGLYFFVPGFFVESKPAPVTKPAEEEKVMIEQETEITLLAVGDIMLGRKVERLMSEYGRGYPFLKVKARLQRADLSFGNLECAVSKGTPLPGRDLAASKPEVIPELSECGFDVLSIANNHSLDYDTEAF